MVATELWLWVCCYSNRVLSSNMLSASHQPRTRSRRKKLASWWEQPRESEHKLSPSFLCTHIPVSGLKLFHLTLREKSHTIAFLCHINTINTLEHKAFRDILGYLRAVGVIYSAGPRYEEGLLWKGDGEVANHLKSHPEKHSLKEIYITLKVLWSSLC